MATERGGRPDIVDIPDYVWASDQLPPYLARLAERHGPIFSFIPAARPHRGERRSASGGTREEDVLGMLVSARDDSGKSLSDEQLLAHVNILLLAGHETTTTLGAWVLYLLARHPEYATRLDTELAEVLGDGPLTSDSLHRLPLLSAAIRKAGRLQSPVLLLPRGVLNDFECAGRHVEAGTQVFVAIAAGHRLASVFNDPDRFDPDRFLPPREEDRRNPYALPTFGGGPRIRLGINFAQVEVMALGAHVRRNLRLQPVSAGPIPQYAGILPTLPERIRVRVAPLDRYATVSE